MKVAVVGATGLVGTRMLEVLGERNFPVDELLPVASERSIGREVCFRGTPVRVIGADEAIDRKPELALFSAGGSVSAQLAPRFAETGCYVVDNSSYWRMDPAKKLVIPEINGDVIGPEDHIIANPNCSTIQMLIAIAPLHRPFKIKRIVVSTYQSVTGTGYKAVQQLEAERRGDAPGSYSMAYPHRIDLNVLPHIDSFLPDGYTKEEMKMVNETHKILDPAIRVTATTVRVPATGGHSESVNLEFEKPFTLGEVRSILSSAPGVSLMDEPENNVYPMPVLAAGRDEVFVGRIRRDDTLPSGLNLWCVSDNLRKGAATNAVQIAELLLKKGLL